jgi:hypothetical protein
VAGGAQEPCFTIGRFDQELKPHFGKIWREGPNPAVPVDRGRKDGGQWSCQNGRNMVRATAGNGPQEAT